MFWRLFGTYGALLLAAIGLLGGVILTRVERYSLEQTEDSLRAKAILVGEALRDRPTGVKSDLRLAEVRHLFVEEVAHGVHEDHSLRSPLERFGELFRD
jgi:hypothetical protein